MNIRARVVYTPPLALALAVSMAVTPLAYAPAAYAQSYASTLDQPAQFAQPAFTQQELDQMLAPIALYPDSLLSQILMAATYPLEVVQAARWSRANSHLRGDQAVRAVENQDWDPSVKSLVAFPQILSMMDDKLNWTERMGDAFLAQQPEVMDTVQRLRQKAYAAGNLRSNEHIRVASQGPVIVVEPAHPQVVYVPYYDPMVVYGLWWWPAYPPVYWAPWPGYYVRPGISAGFVWGSGIAISAGFFFGAFDWPHRHARVVNVNNYYYKRSVVVRHDIHSSHAVRNHVPGEWRHDPDHRRGVPYREASLRQQFSRDTTPEARQHRERDTNPSRQSNQDRRETREPRAHSEVKAAVPAIAPAATPATAPAQIRGQDRRGGETRDNDGRRDNDRASDVRRDDPRANDSRRDAPRANDNRRDDREVARQPSPLRAPDTAQPSVQAAPASRSASQPNAAAQESRTERSPGNNNRGGGPGDRPGRADHRSDNQPAPVPRDADQNRRQASSIQSSQMQEARARTPAVEHRSGSDHRTRVEQPRAAPEPRVAVTAPRAQAATPAPRQAHGPRPEGARGGDRGEGRKDK